MNLRSSRLLRGEWQRVRDHHRPGRPAIIVSTPSRSSDACNGALTVAPRDSAGDGVMDALDLPGDNLLATTSTSRRTRMDGRRLELGKA